MLDQAAASVARDAPLPLGVEMKAFVEVERRVFCRGRPKAPCRDQDRS